MNNKTSDFKKYIWAYEKGVETAQMVLK